MRQARRFILIIIVGGAVTVTYGVVARELGVEETTRAMLG